ncbi:hypothetical protein D9758_003682 [Tetrapyrgos nigripes]|uniref:Uncharacterized protein n=1 Tax=Tetrapyrgos nigripes TaxID=182062 RepID=A0A8H5LRM7_9AGAR|nr:hypothetical protein D9758_003682 [Tetrapyrgos nigripes]
MNYSLNVQLNQAPRTPSRPVPPVQPQPQPQFCHAHNALPCCQHGCLHGVPYHHPSADYNSYRDYSQGHPNVPPPQPSSSKTNDVGQPARTSVLSMLGSSAMRTATDFFINQEVEVTLKSNRIVAGIVISSLQFFKKLAGFGYKVEYRSNNGQREIEPFPPENLRPCGPFSMN